jgi:hypothetical protein
MRRYAGVTPVAARCACETIGAARGTAAARGGCTMKKTNKKSLALSKTTIKQLMTATGAQEVCTFGSTAKEPSVVQKTCLGTCPGDNTCATSYPCI